MRIVRAGKDDVGAWSRLRAQLWPETTAEEHCRELSGLLDAGEDFCGLLALSPADDLAGFAEVALRRDYVNGCETSPVAFLEGIYVCPGYRRRGIAGLLVAAAGAWGKAAGCTEFASDALLDNDARHRMHAALGFTQTERVVFFRKLL